MNKFAHRLLEWHKRHGRHDLPWQQQPDPYRVWVSEIMLQQTQVKTVIPYFKRFMQRFPDVHALGRADINEVLHLWSGLGYYARGRNLHKAAGVICDKYAGVFPEDINLLIALPGIGRSTAGAILALSRQQPHPILDGNVKRVLSRYYGIAGRPGDRKLEDELWDIAARETPKKNVGVYTQAIMDLGATVCTRSRPGCDECPLSVGCYAREQGLQAEFPGRRKPKSLPVKEAVFAIIENSRGEVLLERRPPAGIWGGLWSFPECPQDMDVPSWVTREFGAGVTGLSEQRPLRHSFTHFHLHIRPFRGKLKTTGAGIRDHGEICWYSPLQPVTIGLAAPVKKLLQSLSIISAGADV